MCPGLRSGSLGTTPACLLTLSPWNQHFCSFCLICFVFCVCLVVQSCLTLFDPMDCSLPVSSISGDSPGRNVGVGCHALLQEIFPTWGSNPGLLNCRQILYRLSHGFFFFLIKIWFIQYVVLVSGIQQSDLAIHMCISIFFSDYFHLQVITKY